VRHVAGSSGRSDSVPVEELTTSVPSLPVAFAPLGLKYLEEHELRRSFDAYDTNGNGLINAHEARAMLRDAGAEGSLECAEQAVAAFDSQGRGAISFEELKAAVDVAATPVDGRVRPIYATLTLLFTSQGTQFPVLPQLARSLELSAADVGLLTACTALARLVSNVPAAIFAERVGRRPLLIAGPAVSAVGMCVLGCSSSFAQLAAGNACIGVGMASAMAGASLYLSDIATPRNRAQTTAPLLQSALMGFAIGPALGGVMAQSFGLHLPFVACAAGLVAASGSAAYLLPETGHLVAGRGGNASAGRAEGAARKVSRAALLSRPALQGLGAVVFMNGFSQGAMPVTFVLYATEALQMSSGAVGGVLTLNVLMMVLISAPATKLSDRLVSRKSIMVPALLLNAVSTMAQPLAATPLAFAAIVGSGALTSAVSMPSISPLYLDHVDAEERATALAMRQMAQDVGTLVGASSMGAMAVAYGIPSAMVTVATLQGAAALFFALRVPSTPVRGPNRRPAFAEEK
jgi:predicted MFS family arabinose efflux permease